MTFILVLKFYSCYVLLACSNCCCFFSVHFMRVFFFPWLEVRTRFALVARLSGLLAQTVTVSIVIFLLDFFFPWRLKGLVYLYITSTALRLFF